MKRAGLAATASLLALTACVDMTTEERMVVGGLTGAAVGVLTAEALDADNEWTIIAALSGAAVGTLVARNSATGECAYARGDGTYRVAACR